MIWLRFVAAMLWLAAFVFLSWLDKLFGQEDEE